jgi:membrane protein YdbS with pleckstrin-like domain
MGYLDKQLMNGETVVRRAHLHWIVYLPALGVAAIAVLGAGWLGCQGPQARAAAAVIGALLGAYALYLACGGFIKRRSARFAVTNRRVLIAIGLMRRRSVEMLLSQIEGITVQQGLGGRIFNYGTVVIEGTGGDGVPYPKIAAPGAFRLAVQEQVERGANPGRPHAAPAQGGEPAPSPASRYDELLRLDELKSKGILTEAEFAREKRRLLKN